MKSRIANLWYYHKTIIILGILILMSGIYLGVQKQSVPKPDYCIAVIEPDYSADSRFQELSAAIQKTGEDRNGDGEITLKLSAYHVVLGAENQDIQEIGALDADLAGKVSCLFLLTDPAGFEAATNGILLEEECIPVRELPALAGIGFDSFFAAVREDHPQAAVYQKLIGQK